MFFHYPTLLQVLRATFSRQHFHPIHAVYVILFVSAFLCLRTLVWLVRWLDPVLFSRYRQQQIEAPVYIISNPRSGTTFLHRLLALDERFTTTKLYHTIFPAVAFYKFFDWLGKLDRRLHHPLTQFINWMDRQGFKGWEGIHKTQLNSEEEEEQLFVYTLLSPVIFLLFPFPEALPAASWVDELPAKIRQPLMNYYQDCLQRHLYATGSDKTLLIKNTTMGGRLWFTRELFPDLRIVHVIRHPYESLPSFLSMNAVAWHQFVPQARHNPKTSQAVAQLYCQYYRQYRALKESLPRAQVIEVHYEALVNDPKGTIEHIYRALGLSMTAAYAAKLQAETERSRTYKSRHQYSLQEFGLSAEMIYEQMPDLFEAYGFRV
ncbi:MAG: sulfotransferase [Cyanothece sp. SIO1E1]|nr:sulfotransferase [Cyanothece sp. SIO1E1]